jgi:hypothetical protein
MSGRGLDAFDESEDVFDDDDPFAYSKSKVQDKSSFLAYSKDGSSMASGAGGGGAALSLKDRARLLLEASKNSAASKESASKSAKKKDRKKATATSSAKKATPAASLRHSGASDGSDGSFATPTGQDSLSRTNVDDRWSSRFDEMDDLGIDEKDWETPQQKAAREAAEIEASSIAQLSRSGFGGAIDEPESDEESEEQEEEEVDPLSMTVSQLKDVNMRNEAIRQRKLQKEREKEAAAREAKKSKLDAARAALQAATDRCEDLFREAEEEGALSTTLKAAKMEEALAVLRAAIGAAEDAGIQDTADGGMVDAGEDAIEQLEEALATQIVREGDAERLGQAVAAARKSKDQDGLARAVAAAKKAGNLSGAHPLFAEAAALVQELAEQQRKAREQADRDARAVAMQEALQAAYDKAHGQPLFSDAQRAAVPQLKAALKAAAESGLFRDGDYLVEDARDLVERVDERFARQRAKDAYAALKAVYAEQDDAHSEGSGNYEALKVRCVGCCHRTPRTARTARTHARAARSRTTTKKHKTTPSLLRGSWHTTTHVHVPATTTTTTTTTTTNKQQQANNTLRYFFFLFVVV